MTKLSYAPLTVATFLKRKNRFIAEIQLSDGNVVEAHLAHTGRLTELLVPGVRCAVQRAANPNRKTQWDLFLIEYHHRWICLRAVYANKLTDYFLQRNLLQPFVDVENIRREIKIKNARIDFSFTMNDKDYIAEVKSVNYFKGNMALFPDAPTSRGAHHVDILRELKEEGQQTALILWTLGADVDSVKINENNDPGLKIAVDAAVQAGVEVHAYAAKFDLDGAYLAKKIAFLG